MLKKPYEQLTVGETKALTEEEIKGYAPMVGAEMMKDKETVKMAQAIIGEMKIRAQIKKLKSLEEELMGE